jgi:hypothetical protein
VLCYSWYDDTDFAITGCLMLSENPQACGDDPGPWVVMQSRRAQRAQAT